MSHFAKVENGIVVQVIVAEEDFINSGAVGHGWIQTSYNTRGNQHPEGRPLRGNYAGIGYTYDEVNDVFIAPKPGDEWVLNTSTWLWENPNAPVVEQAPQAIIDAPAESPAGEDTVQPT